MIKRGQSKSDSLSSAPSSTSLFLYSFYLSTYPFHIIPISPFVGERSLSRPNLFSLFFFPPVFQSRPPPSTHARVQLCLPGPEQGRGMYIIPTLRQAWCALCALFSCVNWLNNKLGQHVALDTNSPLPLFNSLTHLTYLTSTSPRIREIMVMDGGLERLVRMLHDFCVSPPPPENPALLYGLLPPNYHPPKPVPTLIPKAFDKHAAYRFSLAFQCIVNIGVRGSELIRSRVVQAGTLDVVGCILESWLASKGFAVGPSSSATGMPRETREQRAARKQAQADMRARQQAAELARALERRQDFSHDSLQTIRGRSRASSATIRAAEVDISSILAHLQTDRPISDSFPLHPPFFFLAFFLFSRRMTGWTHLPTRQRCQTTLMRHRLTYQVLTPPPLPPMLRRLQLAVTQTPQHPPIHQEIRRQRDQTHLPGPSKYLGEIEAAPLSHDPSGTPLPLVGPSAHVIGKVPSLRLPPAALRAQRRKPRMTVMATLTWIPRKKQPIIPRSGLRPLHSPGELLPLFRISGLIPDLASHSSSTRMHT